MSQPPETTEQPLSELERRILTEHDRLASMPAGPRERYIRERLGVSPTRYFQLLNALLDSGAALAFAPVTINRLRRVRETNRKRFW